VGAILGLVLGSYSSAFVAWIDEPGARVALGMLCVLIAFILDAMLLDAMLYQIAGNTPGKFWLRLQVETTDGHRLSFFQYLLRNLLLWASGFAFGLPIINLFTMTYQARRLAKGGQASYDERTGFTVRSRPSSPLRKISFGLIFAVLLMSVAIIEDLEFFMAILKNMRNR
jgi:RDD family